MTKRKRESGKSMSEYLRDVAKSDDYDKDLFADAQLSLADERRADAIIAREKEKIRRLAEAWNSEKEQNLVRPRPSSPTPGNIREYSADLWQTRGNR